MIAWYKKMQSAENHPAQCCEVAEALAMQGQAVVSPQVKQKEKRMVMAVAQWNFRLFKLAESGCKEFCKSVEPYQTHGPLGYFKLSWQCQFYSGKNPLSQKRFKTNATRQTFKLWNLQFMSLTAGFPAKAEGNFSFSILILVKKALTNDLKQHHTASKGCSSSHIQL